MILAAKDLSRFDDDSDSKEAEVRRGRRKEGEEEEEMMKERECMWESRGSRGCSGSRGSKRKRARGKCIHIPTQTPAYTLVLLSLLPITFTPPTKVTINVRCKDLIQMDMLSKSDPKVKVCRGSRGSSVS